MSATARASWRALGCLAVLACDGERMQPARQAVLAVLAEVDQACSRFREDSELSRLNDAGGRPVTVGPVLAAAVAEALRAARLTDGLVDPTVGAAMVSLGYDRDFSQLQGAADLGGVAPVPRTAPPPPLRPAALPPLAPASGGAWRQVELDPVRGAVRLPPGVRLDLGATAKAWAADRAAAAASAAAAGGVLVSLGGDVAVAGPAPQGGWPVRVSTSAWDDPATASGPVVTVHAGGLATSSTVVRAWTDPSGRRAHHLLDPRSGAPATTRWRSVTVAAATALEANIASTAAVLLDERAPDWLRARGLAAYLVDRQGQPWHLGGWPEEPTVPLHDARPGAAVGVPRP